MASERLKVLKVLKVLKQQQERVLNVEIRIFSKTLLLFKIF